MSVPTKNTESRAEESVLPPGKRDGSGFWYPAGYSDPKTLVRPRRRRRKNGPTEAQTKPTETPGH